MKGRERQILKSISTIWEKFFQHFKKLTRFVIMESAFLMPSFRVRLRVLQINASLPLFFFG